MSLRTLPSLRALFFFAALGIPSCSSDEPRAPEPQADEIHYELLPWTRELSAETLAAIRDLGAEDGTVRVAGHPAELEGLAPGDVLLAGASETTPDGLLRMVVSTSPDGDGTKIATKPVGIQLAFKNLHARVTARRAMLDGTPADGVEPQAKVATSKSVGGGKVIDWRVFDQDGNRETKDDQLYVHAEVKGALTITAYVDLDWAGDVGRAASEAACALAYPVCKPRLPNVKMGARAEMEAGYSIDAEGAAATAYESGEILIDDASVDLPTISLGPVVIKPTVDFVAEVSGSASTRFHARSALRYTVATEVSVSLREGPTFVTPTFTRELDPPSVDAILQTEVTAAVGPRLSLMFWDTVGPTVSLRGYGRLRADSEREPCFALDLGADMRAGIRLRVPWRLFELEALGDLFGLSGDIYRKSFGPFGLFGVNDVASGACATPSGSIYPPGEGPTDQAYKDANLTPWSRRYLDWDTTFPFSGEVGEKNLHVDKTIDGAWVVTGKGIPGVLKLSETGDVVWAKQLFLPAAGDESVSDSLSRARSAVAAQALDTNLWVATSRFRILKLDQDGDLVWAKWHRPPGAEGLELARELDPVALVTTADGGALVLYALRYTANDGPALLLRIAADGTLLWSKRFAYETEKTFAPVLVDDGGGGAFVAGFSWEPGASKAHVARLGADGSVMFARTLSVCEDARVRPNRGIRLASGALALVGSYSAGRENTFLAQIAPDGGEASVAAFRTGDHLMTRGNGIAQLPVTGFLTLAGGRYFMSNDGYLVLTSHEGTGAVTWQRELTMRDPDASVTWHVEPGAVRLTNDGGALVFATVNAPGTTGSSGSGIWVTKVPARTGEGPFDTSKVQSVEGEVHPQDCTVVLGADPFQPSPVELTTMDVTKSIVVEKVTPKVETLMP
jgi:hypothetical protein